jgi:nucleoside-diphosphate-sugar epimerase
MSVFITGVTGYVGKHLLRYFLSLTNRQIVVCIREKHGISGLDRFDAEIKQSPMFNETIIQKRLVDVTVIEKDVHALTKTDLEACTDVIHCAANVKFNAPYQTLFTENVTALKKIYRLCKTKKFYYISTCYVHPKTSEGPYPSIKIPGGLDKTNFICEYAYTKYLAEQYLYKQTGFIDIIRLSCVGCPIEDVAPMRGGAHLAILEVVERATLPDVWIPERFQFSTVPVDILCKAIIDRTKDTRDGLHIVQYSAPAKSKTYNFEVDEILSHIPNAKVKIWSGISYSKFLAWMNFFYWWIPSVLKRILDANSTISYVSRNQTFHSDLELPKLEKDEYIEITISYIKKLVKSNPKYQNPFVSILLYLYTFIKSTFIYIAGQSWISSYDD